MRGYTVDRRMAVCAGLLIGALGLCGASRPPLPTVPNSVDEMLDVALRSNPEVLVAEAKLRQAMAELNQVRLKVTQEVFKLQAARESLERAVQGRAVELKRVEELYSKGLGPQEEVMKARIALDDAQAAFGEWPAQARYLLGLGGSPALGPDQTQPGPTTQPAPASQPRPPVPEKFKEALEMPVVLTSEGELELRHLLDYLQQATGKKATFMAGNDISGVSLPTMSLNLPLRSVLLAIHDSVPEICFIIREYGILAASRDRAIATAGAAIPEDLPYIPE